MELMRSEHACATCDTAYTFVDADVTIHETQESMDVNSTGFSGRETYLEQYFREAEAFGAWEHVSLIIVSTFRKQCSLCRSHK